MTAYRKACSTEAINLQNFLPMDPVERIKYTLELERIGILPIETFNECVITYVVVV